MSDVLQILKNTSARPRVTFYSDGVPTDLDSGVPAVVITRPDGTTIASGTVSHVGAAGTGTYEFTLAAQPNETFLTVTWSGPIGGLTQTITTYIEVIGSFLFTLAGLRSLKVAGGTPFANSTAYPDAQLLDTRTEVLEEFTDILGFSPVPRFYWETLSVPYGGQVVLAELHVQRILSVSVAGVAQSVSNYYLTEGGVLQPVSGYYPGYWTSFGYGVVTCEYVAGWPRVKGDGGDVAMLRAAMKLDPGISATASTVTTPDGSSYSFDAAGQVTRGGTIRHFGIAAIDSWLQRHSAAGLAVA
jgi:hypothetical protein